MATQVLEKELERRPEGPACQHYWILESPSGATSRGVCKHCGKVRQFQNATQDFVWEEERSADLTYWGAGEVKKILDKKVEAS